MEAVRSYRDGALVVIELRWEQVKAIAEANAGADGGFQRLFQRLCSGITPVYGAGWYLSMHPDDARRVVKYAHSYGNGGWQNALRLIVDDVRRSLGEGNLESQPDLPLE